MVKTLIDFLVLDFRHGVIAGWSRRELDVMTPNEKWRCRCRVAANSATGGQQTTSVLEPPTVGGLQPGAAPSSIPVVKVDDPSPPSRLARVCPS
jgi:hypothetical protein